MTKPWFFKRGLLKAKGHHPHRVGKTKAKNKMDPQVKGRCITITYVPSSSRLYNTHTHTHTHARTVKTKRLEPRPCSNQLSL